VYSIPVIREMICKSNSPLLPILLLHHLSANVCLSWGIERREKGRQVLHLVSIVCPQSPSLCLSLCLSLCSLTQHLDWILQQNRIDDSRRIMWRIRGGKEIIRTRPDMDKSGDRTIIKNCRSLSRGPRVRRRGDGNSGTRKADQPVGPDAAAPYER
jgi:hypothetical protein